MHEETMQGLLWSMFLLWVVTMWAAQHYYFSYKREKYERRQAEERLEHYLTTRS